MSTVPIMALFAFAAVINSGILGGVLLWRGRRSHLVWLGAMFLCIGFLLAVYALEHYDRLRIEGWLRVSYDLASLLLSCFLLEYVVGGLWRRHAPVGVYAPVAVYSIALLVGRSSFLEWLTIGRLVFVQSLYTMFALGLCASFHDTPWKTSRWNRTWVHLSVISIAFLAVHVAHFLSGRGGDDLAPIVGIVALIGMTSYALTSARFSGWMSPPPRLGGEKSRELLEALDRVMRDERPFTQPDLDLSTLARAVGCTAQNLSAALNTELGKTFYEYVTTFRVEEAKQLLRDPKRQHLSLEALGTESGFRSRSSFYSAFKSATGSTPGEYRKARDS